MDIYSFLEDINQLSGAGEFEQLISKYDKSINAYDGLSVGSDDEALMLFGQLPIKWYAMAQVGQQALCELEIIALAKANIGNFRFWGVLCQTLEDYQMTSLLDIIEEAIDPQRIILTARVRQAQKSADVAKGIMALSVFNEVPVDMAYEDRIYIVTSDSDAQRTVWTQKQCIKARHNCDLPNNNAYYLASFIADGMTAELCLPYPDNDNICADGYFSTVRNGVESRYSFQAQQLLQPCSLSPYEVQLSMNNLQLTVANTQVV